MNCPYVLLFLVDITDMSVSNSLNQKRVVVREKLPSQETIFDLDKAVKNAPHLDAIKEWRKTRGQLALDIKQRDVITCCIKLSQRTRRITFIALAASVLILAFFLLMPFQIYVLQITTIIALAYLSYRHIHWKSAAQKELKELHMKITKGYESARKIYFQNK